MIKSRTLEKDLIRWCGPWTFGPSARVSMPGLAAEVPMENTLPIPSSLTPLEKAVLWLLVVGRDGGKPIWKLAEQSGLGGGGVWQVCAEGQSLSLLGSTDTWWDVFQDWSAAAEKGRLCSKGRWKSKEEMLCPPQQSGFMAQSFALAVREIQVVANGCSSEESPAHLGWEASATDHLLKQLKRTRPFSMNDSKPGDCRSPSVPSLRAAGKPTCTWLQKTSKFLEGAEGSVWTLGINKQAQARGEVLLGCPLVAEQEDLICAAKVKVMHHDCMTMRWKNFKSWEKRAWPRVQRLPWMSGETVSPVEASRQDAKEDFPRDQSSWAVMLPVQG